MPGRAGTREWIAVELVDVPVESLQFKPPGMRHTEFGLKPENRHRLASVFKRVTRELVGEQKAESRGPQVVDDAGLLATANDYVCCIQMLLGTRQYGERRLLKEKSAIEMAGDQIGDLVVEKQPTAKPESSNPYALGAGEDNFGLGIHLE